MAIQTRCRCPPESSPTAAHEIGHSDALRRDGRLRKQTEGAGELLGRDVVHIGAVEQHMPRARREQAGHRSQERRLAARVRPDDRGDHAGRHEQVEVLDHSAVAVAERELVDGERVGCCHSEPPERLLRTIK
jgi:hypothetical protein